VAGDVPVVAGAVTVVVGAVTVVREPSLLWQERHCCRRAVTVVAGAVHCLSPEPSLLWRKPYCCRRSRHCCGEPSLLSPEPSLLSLDIILERDGLLSNGGVSRIDMCRRAGDDIQKVLEQDVDVMLSPEMSLLSSESFFEGGDGTTSQLQTPTFGSRDRHSTRFR